jgi:hypothetical protein
LSADNLSKAGRTWAASRPWILAGEKSSLLTRIATTVNASFCVRMKDLRLLWNSESAIRGRRAVCLDKLRRFFKTRPISKDLNPRWGKESPYAKIKEEDKSP